ncbi:unnamed protein product [marine sediment metagenome]|uniref:Uncharacterized protein n=1 Tax=marine sediment metagenome TaxID=412755 RepID=X1RTA2_9ZZZZ
MNNFKLNPGDILVQVNDRNDPFSKVKRWVAGEVDGWESIRGASLGYLMFHA